MYALCNAGESDSAVEAVLCDQFRLTYYQQYIGNATKAVKKDRVKVKVTASPFSACLPACLSICLVGDTQTL
jgi:hypothetical protein